MSLENKEMNVEAEVKAEVEAQPPTIRKDNHAFASIPIGSLMVGEFNVRTDLHESEDDESTIATLTDNIGQYGLLNPLTVCPSPKEQGKYEILAGQRRFEALRRLQWAEVPCRVLDIKDPIQAQMVSFAENMQRVPMTKGDKCQTINQLHTLHDGDLDAVCGITNLSKTTVRRYLKLAQKLAAPLIQQFDEDSPLTLEVANMLTDAVSHMDKQEEVYDAIRDLSTGRQKKVLKALQDNPEQDVEEIVNGVEEKEASKQQVNKIKKNPWCFDRNEAPVSIPSALFPRVMGMIEQHKPSVVSKKRRR
jgi:ParB/RepB/Spo0J family partition protein